MHITSQKALVLRLDEIKAVLTCNITSTSLCHVLDKAMNHKVHSQQLPEQERGKGGGGGFFLTCKNLGRMFTHSFPARAFLFDFFKWRLAHTH